MENVGKVSTGLVVAIFLAGVVVGVLSLPDIRRYIKMRQM